MMKHIETPLLELQDVSFGYTKTTKVFEGVSFSVRAGEFISLLGPNGAGKTSLIRVLSGVYTPLHGAALLQGKDLRHWPRRDAAREVAVVPQEMYTPFAYTVRELIELGRTPYLQPMRLGLLSKDDKNEVDRAIELSGLQAYASRIFQELSGGERQRVIIAAALAQHPRALLLDEPTSHLDIRYQIETLELLQKLHLETGLTVFASMHDLNLAARYFPRLILFNHGVALDGPPSAALRPEILKKIYHVDIKVGVQRGSSYLSVVSPSEREKPANGEHTQNIAVHIVAGGGTGDLVMRAMAELRIPFSIGAVNIGDSDTTLAESLAEQIITEPPYAPVSQDSAEQALTAMLAAEHIVICPIPIGGGNAVMLDIALRAMTAGAKIWLYEPQLAQQNDFVTQEADVLELVARRDYSANKAGVSQYQQLLRSGAIMVSEVGVITTAIMAQREVATLP